MGSIAKLTEFLVWGIIGSAAFIIFLKASTDRINLRGLLQSKGEPGISPARVQFLFTALIGAFGYLGTVSDALVSAATDSTKLLSLPPVPDAVLMALGGSSGVYLAAKGLITGRWLDRFRTN